MGESRDMTIYSGSVSYAIVVSDSNVREAGLGSAALKAETSKVVL
jgi:hypothetical protein